MADTIDIDTIQWIPCRRDYDAERVWGYAEDDLSDYGISLGTYDAHAKIDGDRWAFRINYLNDKFRVVIVTMCWDADVGGEGDLVDCSYVLRVEVCRG